MTARAALRLGLAAGLLLGDAGLARAEPAPAWALGTWQAVGLLAPPGFSQSGPNWTRRVDDVLRGTRLTVGATRLDATDRRVFGTVSGAEVTSMPMLAPARNLVTGAGDFERFGETPALGPEDVLTGIALMPARCWAARCMDAMAATMVYRVGGDCVLAQATSPVVVVLARRRRDGSAPGCAVRSSAGPRAPR